MYFFMFKCTTEHFKTEMYYLSARPQVTFDLLGSDHLVLARLIHTLGLFMHLAVNAPVSFIDQSMLVWRDLNVELYINISVPTF